MAKHSDPHAYRALRKAIFRQLPFWKENFPRERVREQIEGFIGYRVKYARHLCSKEAIAKYGWM